MTEPTKAQKYASELNKFFCNIERVLERINRLKYVRVSSVSGKHVLIDCPIGVCSHAEDVGDIIRGALTVEDREVLRKILKLADGDALP